MRKAVLDTNIFISGIFWKGSSNKVIVNWKERKFILVTSLKAISEIIKVLKDFKVRLSDDMINEWIDLIIRNSVIIEPKEKIDVVKDDPKDNIFIETAVSGNADYIISQDNHLLKLKKFREIKIITASAQNAKKAHLFHINKKIVNTTLRSEIIPKAKFDQVGNIERSLIWIIPKYDKAKIPLKINIKTNQIVRNVPLFLSESTINH